MSTMTPKKKLKDYPAYKENPFIEPMIDVIKEKYKTVTVAKTNGEEAMIASNGDNYQSTMVTHIKRKVDSEAFVKIYQTNLSAIFDLSKSAQAVLQYILTIIKPNSDKVYISPRHVLDNLKYKSRSTLYAGLEEVISKDIISRSDETNMYFINPAIVFNGSRLRIIQDYQMQPGIDASGKKAKAIGESEDKDWE